MRIRNLPALLLASIVSVHASAAPVTYEFSTTWLGESISSYPDWYDFGIPVGTAISGSFTLETSTPAVVLNPGVWSFRDVLTAATIRIGPDGTNGIYELGGPYAGTNYSSSMILLDDVEFGGNPPYDQLGFGANLGTVAGDRPGLTRSFGFSASSWGDLFLTPPTLDNVFESVRPGYPLHLWFSVGAQDGNGESVDAGIGAIVDTVQVASVPEPATLALLGAGLLGLFGAKRRRTAPRAV